MSRRASTSLEKATTPRGEEFLANPKLKAALETLGKVARTELGDKDTDFPFGAIRDGAAMLAATEFDVWQVTNRQRTEDEIRRLQVEVDNLSGELSSNHAKLAK